MTERISGTLRLKLTGEPHERRVAALVHGQPHLPDLSRPDRRCIDCRHFVRRKTRGTAKGQCDEPRNAEHRRKNRVRKVEYDGSCDIGCSLFEGGDK